MSGKNRFQSSDFAASFAQQLEKAISRGERAGEARRRAEAQKTVEEREFHRLHTQFRLELCDYIEDCLRRIAEQLPGFQMEPVVSEQGWGAAVTRDDFEMAAGRRPTTRFSRLEMTVHPLTEARVLELTVKATIRSKEFFNRDYYQPLGEIDPGSFQEKIDLWALEFVEFCARKS
jgi:hypothetical protein